ncbi:MAG: IS3 family transposase [Pseudonocardiaceae bacterium]
MNIYPFIEAEKQASTTTPGGGNVARACELMRVSRSAYYSHAAVRAAGGTTREREDAELTKRITEIHAESTGTYGAPRTHAELAEQGHRHGRKRIARLMRQAGLRGRTPRRWRTTTIADPAAPARPDLIGRNFTPNPFGVDQRWCGDITYIRTWQGWLYLATVIDIASRRVVGWATADHLRTDLVEQALRNAVTTRRPQAEVIFHSDRGCQYTSAQFAETATELGVRLSVGRTGQCWDNALAESFFATIKGELLEHRSWTSHTTARGAIFDYIEGWYNTRRKHSALGYLSPSAYENTAATRAA